MNFGTFQIKGTKALVQQTHNKMLIVYEFYQGTKREAMMGNRIEKEKVETEATVSDLGKFK